MPPTAFEEHGRLRVLVVTPGFTFLPPGAGNLNDVLPGEAGQPADLDAAFVCELQRAGVDVHVTFPHYRRMFQAELADFLERELKALRDALPAASIHPAQDRAFYCQDEAAVPPADAVRLSLVFQREVMSRIVPMLRPCLLHCNDWMTGLLPAAARSLGLRSVFTAHRLCTRRFLLGAAEAAAWDPLPFWRNLYYASMPGDYRETLLTNPVDALASGVFACDFLTTPSPTFLGEVVGGQHPHVPEAVRREIERKQAAGAAAGVLNPPDSTFDPAVDPELPARYSDPDAAEGKRRNKSEFQRLIGLSADESAALFFWPSRLDPEQKGAALLTHILAVLTTSSPAAPVQIAVVADGVHQKTFRDEIRHHGLERSVALHDFSPALSRLGYAASDFTLVPSLFEPAGRAAMAALRYGSLPLVRDTGANNDTVRPLDPARETGNGFVFRDYDSAALRAAIEQALAFFALAPEVRAATVARVMKESRHVLTPEVCARRYASLYGAVHGAPETPSWSCS